MPMPYSPLEHLEFRTSDLVIRGTRKGKQLAQDHTVESCTATYKDKAPAFIPGSSSCHSPDPTGVQGEDLQQLLSNFLSCEVIRKHSCGDKCGHLLSQWWEGGSGQRSCSPKWWPGKSVSLACCAFCFLAACTHPGCLSKAVGLVRVAALGVYL